VPPNLVKFYQDSVAQCHYYSREQALLYLPTHVTKVTVEKAQALYIATKHRMFHLVNSLYPDALFGAIFTQWRHNPASIEPELLSLIRRILDGNIISNGAAGTSPKLNLVKEYVFNLALKVRSFILQFRMYC
jgi:hypothetical protein